VEPGGVATHSPSRYSPPRLTFFSGRCLKLETVLSFLLIPGRVGCGARLSLCLSCVVLAAILVCVFAVLFGCLHGVQLRVGLAFGTLVPIGTSEAKVGINESVKCLGLSCLGCRLTGLVSEISGKSTHVLSVDWLNLLWAGLSDTGSASGTLIPSVPVRQGLGLWLVWS
jgi:hypothetical protein